MSEEQKTQLTRRSFLKIAGLVGAAVQAGGLVAGGVCGRRADTGAPAIPIGPGRRLA